jgi:hypothetical protein
MDPQEEYGGPAIKLRIEQVMFNLTITSLVVGFEIGPLLSEIHGRRPKYVASVFLYFIGEKCCNGRLWALLLVR